VASVPNLSHWDSPTGTSNWDNHNLSQWDKLIGTGCTCPSGTSTTCSSGTSILEQVLFVPVGQAGWLYQTCPIGTRTGQKRPLLEPWHKSYTHSMERPFLVPWHKLYTTMEYLFHLSQLAQSSSQNSYSDCYGSFDEQGLFSFKFARFRKFFDFAQIWGILESDKL